jgi:hypothetical protein
MAFPGVAIPGGSLSGGIRVGVLPDSELCELSSDCKQHDDGQILNGAIRTYSDLSDTPFFRVDKQRELLCA